MTVARFHIDSFSGEAADLPKRHRTMDNLLRALARDPLVSCWDMGEYPWLRDLVFDGIKAGFLASADQPYPWCRYILTDTGKARLESLGPIPAGRTSKGQP